MSPAEAAPDTGLPQPSKGCRALRGAPHGALCFAREHNTMTSNSECGTVSAGTLRPEDLIPRFMEALSERIEASTFDDGADAPERVQAIDRLQDRLGDLERRSATEGYFDTEEPQWVLEWLFDQLSNYAPPGCRFGAHEGDGADFGFWSEGEDDGG